MHLKVFTPFWWIYSPCLYIFYFFFIASSCWKIKKKVKLLVGYEKLSNYFCIKVYQFCFCYYYFCLSMTIHKKFHIFSCPIKSNEVFRNDESIRPQSCCITKLLKHYFHVLFGWFFFSTHIVLIFNINILFLLFLIWNSSCYLL